VIITLGYYSPEHCKSLNQRKVPYPGIENLMTLQAVKTL